MAYGQLSQEFQDKLYSNFGQSFEDFMNGKYDQPEETDRWTGFVIDNFDIQYRGRVKVLILGKYDNIPEASIPWAVPDISYLGAKAGNFVVPEKGTVLRGYFDHGDIMKPVFDSVAFGLDNVMFANPFAGTMSDYPNTMILMQTDLGECLTLNRTNGETIFRHRSGTIIKFLLSGEIDINAGATGAINIAGNGNISISTQTGNIDVKTEAGNVSIDSTSGMVNLGRNAAKQFVNNLPTCLATGAPHFVGNTNVMC